MKDRWGKEVPQEGQGRLSLVVNGPAGGEPVRVPVTIASLSATGALLKCATGEKSLELMPGAGREARLLVPPGKGAAGLEVKGRLSWVRPGGCSGADCLVGFELQEPGVEVRRILENRMEIYPRDLKELWDSWDELQRRRPLPMAEQAAYLVGVGAMAAGTALYLAGPESLRLYGSVLALYGCVMMAAKSLWAMWRSRPASPR